MIINEPIHDHDQHLVRAWYSLKLLSNGEGVFIFLIMYLYIDQ